MSSRMKVTKKQTGDRRSHHALKAPRLSVCENCGDYHQRHRVCLECGFYRGKQILNSKTEKKEVKAETEVKEKKTKKEEK